MAFEDFANTGLFQYGYPLASALIAAALPNRGARAVQALNTGMGIANAYSQQQKNDQQKALEQQKIGDIFKTTKPVSSTSTVAAQPVDAGTAEFSLPDDQPLPTRPAPAAIPLQKQTTTTQQPVFSPTEQKLGEALMTAQRPDAALSILAQRLM